MSLIIGIDLGTTNSVVAYMKDGHPVVVPNLEGDALTPSVVAFAEDGRRWVGRIAKTQAPANPLRTVFSIKRRMGSTRTAREEQVAVVSSIKRRMGSDNVVTVGERTYTPVEISAMILEKLKVDTQTYLGEPIERAVITVPAYFNDSQRRATREAGALAGLEVVRLVNEPTAASLAYGLDIEKAHTILVWDLGGGTFDVSILELGDGVFEVKAVNGNTRLGGDDYDQRLAELLVERFRDEWDVDLNGDPTARRMTLQLAEQAKIRLSSETEARVVLPACLDEPRALAREDSAQAKACGSLGRCGITITREAFEAATADITEKMVAPAECALSDAGLEPCDLDRVVLVGGMTRMPAVRRLVKKLTGIEPYGHIDPDQVVALGAAIQAGVLAGPASRWAPVRNVTLVDVTPLSLGIETKGELFARIIHRNTPIPTTKSKLFTNAMDDQTVMEIHVLQGERELAPDNVTLDRFELCDITPQPRGEARMEVSFDIDANGMVHVSATDLQTETTKRIRVQAACQPAAEEVARILAESREKTESDRRRRGEIEAALRGENLILAVGKLVGDLDPSHTVQCPSHTVQCPSHTVQCPSHTVQCPSHTVQCPSHTVHGVDIDLVRDSNLAPATPDRAVRQAIEAAENGAAQVRAAMADGRLERITSANETLEARLKMLDHVIKAARQPAGCHCS